MGSKAFLSMGVLIFTALLFASDQVIARDLAETPTYHKNEDGTIKPNGVGKAKNVPCNRYSRSCEPSPYGRGYPPAYNRGGYP